MNTKTLIEIGKLLFIAAIFIAPLIIKFLKKKSEGQTKSNRFARKPVAPLRPKPKPVSKKEINFNEIISELFGVPEEKPAPAQKSINQKQPFRGPEFKNIDAEKLMPELPTEEKAFQRIDLQKNVVAKIEREVSVTARLTQSMTSKDWQKAIILKEILEPPLALR